MDHISFCANQYVIIIFVTLFSPYQLSNNTLKVLSYIISSIPTYSLVYQCLCQSDIMMFLVSVKHD